MAPKNNKKNNTKKTRNRIKKEDGGSTTDGNNNHKSMIPTTVAAATATATTVPLTTATTERLYDIDTIGLKFVFTVTIGAADGNVMIEWIVDHKDDGVDTVRTKKDHDRVKILLEDALRWLLVNIFPYIHHLLYIDETICVMMKKQKFVEDCILCTYLNHIIKCLGWAIIDPFCLLRTSTMSEEIQAIIYQRRCTFIEQSLKGRHVEMKIEIEDSTHDEEEFEIKQLLPLIGISTSRRCSSRGGATNEMKLCVPGLAEHYILEEGYYTDPTRKTVYYQPTNGNGGILKKLTATPIYDNDNDKSNKNVVVRYSVRLNTKYKGGGDGGNKSFELERVIYCSVFPYSAPSQSIIEADATAQLHKFISILEQKEEFARSLTEYALDELLSEFLENLELEEDDYHDMIW